MRAWRATSTDETYASAKAIFFQDRFAEAEGNLERGGPRLAGRHPRLQERHFADKPLGGSFRLLCSKAVTGKPRNCLQRT